MLFLSHLQQRCVQLEEKIAIELGTQRLTYGQLETNVCRTMRFLQQFDVQAGDRVAIQLPKCLPFVLLHLATMRLGAISLPLNPAYPQRETDYFLNDAAVKLHISTYAGMGAWATCQLDGDFGRFRAQLAQLTPSDVPLPTEPTQTALMIYTSGTTGRPKGAQITHENLTTHISGLVEMWGWREADILLHVLPIFHIHGLTVALHAALHAGATTVALPKFTPKETLDALVAKRATVFMGVPTIHRRLVNYPAAASYDLSHMRLLTSGSDRLPDDLFYGFQQLFGHTLLERYGMSETGINLSNPLDGERRVGSVGMPLPGVEVRIAEPATDKPLPDGDIGEVQIRGANVFKGYWQMPAKTAASFSADNWFRTGDLGLREPDGYFTLKGRAKDLIITGGLNVYPPEVELVLSELEEVAACAVVGVPDDEWGETVTAVLVLKGGAVLTSQRVSEHCRANLAGYKAPQRIIFASSLPRNALGKVQKARLRTAYDHAADGT